MSQLFFGLGTELMGMRILRIILDTQPSSLCTSECLPVNVKLKKHLQDMKERGLDFVGDIHMNWLDHVEKLIKLEPDVKIFTVRGDNLDPFYEISCRYFEDIYEKNFRIFSLSDVLYEFESQRELMEWLGFEKWQHFLELNEKGQYIGRDEVILRNFCAPGAVPCSWCDNGADYEITNKTCKIIALACKECADGRELGYFSNWVREETIYEEE